MRYAFYFAIALCFASAASARDRIFGDWVVSVDQGELDPEPAVTLRTKFQFDNDNGDERKTAQFGFRLFSPRSFSLEVYGIEGKNFWPHCDFEFTTYAVDGAKAGYFPDRDAGGICKPITPGSWISEFQRGSKARLRINYRVGTISLKGFSQAWRYAIQSI